MFFVIGLRVEKERESLDFFVMVLRNNIFVVVVMAGFYVVILLFIRPSCLTVIIVNSKKIWRQRSSSPSHHLASTQGKAAYAAETENRVRLRLIREWQGMRGY